MEQAFKKYADYTRSLYMKFAKELKWSEEPESILDVGIGGGELSTYVLLPILPEKIKEYIGCDLFESALKIAEGNLNHEKFSTYQMDILTKNIPEEFKNRFHHVFANYLFHHTQDLR